jgi:LPS export ABC transporter protein LptC
VNINFFFIVLLGSLFTIYLVFKPLEVKQNIVSEIPMFELEKFKITELNQQRLTTIMNGKKGTRFKDRYEVENIDYTDNSKKYLTSMVANRGVYKGSLINLQGDIVFKRQDGLSFHTQEANYDKKTNIVISPKEYVAYLGENKMTGSYLKYNNLLKTVDTKKITVNYILEERKR